MVQTVRVSGHARYLPSTGSFTTVFDFQFQLATVTAAFRFYKAKCDKQRAVIEQLKGGFQQYNEIKSYVNTPEKGRCLSEGLPYSPPNRANDALQQELLHLRAQIQQSDFTHPNGKRRRLDSSAGETMVSDTSYQSR